MRSVEGGGLVGYRRLVYESIKRQKARGKWQKAKGRKQGAEAKRQEARLEM